MLSVVRSPKRMPLPVGIDAGDGDVVGHASTATSGSDAADRLVELDREDAVVVADVVGRQVEPVGEVEDQPAKALLVGDEELDLVVGQRRHRREDEAKAARGRAASGRAAPASPIRCAAVILTACPTFWIKALRLAVRA